MALDCVAARQTTIVLMLGCALRTAAPASAQPPATPSATARLTPGSHEFGLRYDGRAREYIVYVPPRATDRPAVLLAFHGGGGNAKGFQGYAGLDRVADRNGFLVVYPNGTGPLRSVLLTWNAGDDCCGYARQQHVDDVGFTVALLNDLERRTPIDRHRIYATGHSNGAILAHRLAAERADLIAAIAPVAGSLDVSRFAPLRPVPVLQIHSVDDPRALYDGGLGPPFPGTNARVLHQPVQDGLDRWIAADGCPPRPDTTEMRHGDAGTPNAAHSATKLVWAPCRGGAEVAHWKLTVAGHAWPGDQSSRLPERFRVRAPRS